MIHPIISSRISPKFSHGISPGMPAGVPPETLLVTLRGIFPWIFPRIPFSYPERIFSLGFLMDFLWECNIVFVQFFYYTKDFYKNFSWIFPKYAFLDFPEILPVILSGSFKDLSKKNLCDYLRRFLQVFLNLDRILSAISALGSLPGILLIISTGNALKIRLRLSYGIPPSFKTLMVFS